MSRCGRPPVRKPWLIQIEALTRPRSFIILARTREEAEHQARLIVKQSFPFSSFSIRRYYGRVEA